MIFSELVNTQAVLYNMPMDRDEVRVQCESDITIEFWNPAAHYWDAVATDITAPGGFLGVLNSRARITSTGPTNVTIL